jgi:hypothetical protein
MMVVAYLISGQGRVFLRELGAVVVGLSVAYALTHGTLPAAQSNRCGFPIQASCQATAPHLPPIVDVISSVGDVPPPGDFPRDIQLWAIASAP